MTSTGGKPGTARLDDPATLADRIAALEMPHVAPLDGFVASLRARHGTVPHVDPFDGGTSARLLLLLETPGPSEAPVRFVSRDNHTGTAANLRRFLSAAGWQRGEVLLWNAVPWVIHAPGARNRKPDAAETAAGLATLPTLLGLLPQLRAVVLAGRVAGRAAPLIGRCVPAVPVFSMPHPSPVHVCTSPAIATRIVETLAMARALVPPAVEQAR